MKQINLVLASCSPYRCALLGRLGLDFSTQSPDIDETPHENETARQLVQRLALQKAQSIAERLSDALVIGSDQVAVCDNRILGKPGNAERAMAQLTAMSGKDICFQTGLCLLDANSMQYEIDVIEYRVQLRALTTTEIEKYIQLEKPFNCAGSFKSEGLGIALFEKMTGDDPTALIGLPLIRLAEMLRQHGIALP